MAYRTFDRIKGIEVEDRSDWLWPDGYNYQRFYPLREKWYRRAEITPSEPKFPYLVPLLTDELRAENASREACGRCRGRGSTRKDQNVGCHVCLGRGSVPVASSK